MAIDVLIIEDQEKIARLIRDYLKAAGLHCQWRRNGMSLENDLNALQPTIVVLDRMLPGPDGLALCRAIRRHSEAGVIMLTARVEESERLDGFAAGADDYVCKPFSPRELVARVRALMSRQGHLPGGRWRADPLTFEDASMQVSGPAATVCLSALQYRMLSHLARRPGQIFSRDRLMSVGRGDGRVLNDRTVDSHIRTLRNRLDEVAPGTALIETVYGAGYRFRH